MPCQAGYRGRPTSNRRASTQQPQPGYRCAICKAPSPLEIDHIIEWSEVHEDKFENMIVLCRNCHGMKKDGSNPRQINRLSLQQIKSKLMMLNGRYSDLERRIIEVFQEYLAANPQDTPSVLIPERMGLLAWYLIRDGMVSPTHYQSQMAARANDGTDLSDQV